LKHRMVSLKCSGRIFQPCIRLQWNKLNVT
uniref:DUF3265 domain-containing protein n=1 Tax=Anisakis simplex TaxID=6269 RepID=A0A0M3JLC6_ANISI